VVAIDRAVEERARTIQEFEMPQSRFHGLALPDYEAHEFSGITLETLLALAPEQVDPNYDLLAGLLVSPNVTFDGLGETFVSSADTAFAPFFRTQFDLVGKKLDYTYDRLRLYPRDEVSLQTQMTSANIELRGFRDPWGRAYRYKFAHGGSEEGFQVWTDGPDEEAESDDDFTVFERRWPYFQKYGEMMDRAQAEYHKRTGRFIREAATLKIELRRHGVNFDALRDPWGNPYQLEFGVDRAHFTITVCRRNATEPYRALWRSRINYWLDMEAEVKVALVDGQARTGRYPGNADEFFRTLKRAGISRGSLVDGWGNPLQPLFAREWTYTDKFVVRSVASFGEPARTREDVVPTNQEVGHWRLMSRGPDGLEGTADDFVLGNFSNVLSETTIELKGGSTVPAVKAKGQAEAAKVPPALVSGTTGAISGVVTDPAGAVIPGAEVTAVDERTAKLFRAVSSDEGMYAVSDLPIVRDRARRGPRGRRVPADEGSDPGSGKPSCLLSVARRPPHADLRAKSDGDRGGRRRCRRKAA